MGRPTWGAAMTPMSGMLIRRFEEQFTPHGLGYLYRENRVGAAIWVSVQERADFIATFVRALERLWWQILIVFAVVLVALTAAAVVLGLYPATGFQLLLGLASAGVMFGYVKLLGRRYRAPARVLADRTPDEPALNRVEARKLAAESQPWTVFLTGPLNPALLWSLLGPRHDLLAGWHLAWVVGTGAYVAAMAFFAWRKWRIVRGDAAQA